MGAWDQDNYGGIFSVLGGIAVLVFAGIGVSLVVDNRVSSSGPVIELQDRVARQGRTIHEMRIRWRVLDARLQQTAGFRDHESRSQELTTLLGAERDRRRSLERRIGRLENEIRRLDAESREYRQRYQLAARKAAIGRTFDTFALPDGRRYSKVEITGHDDEGLRIHHRLGVAKIRYADLPPEWKERLQWTPAPPEPPAAAPDAVRQRDLNSPARSTPSPP